MSVSIGLEGCWDSPARLLGGYRDLYRVGSGWGRLVGAPFGLGWGCDSPGRLLMRSGISTGWVWVGWVGWVGGCPSWIKTAVGIVQGNC